MSYAYAMLFGEWFMSIGVLVAMFIGVGVIRAGVSRTPLSPLAPQLARLSYIVGLHLFAEFAPLTPRVSAWVDAAAYVLTVLIILGLLRRAAMLGIEWSAFKSLQSKTLQQGFIPLMRNVITLFVFFAGAIMILQYFKYDVLSLLTALGVGSLAVGLAAKETLSNMISGFTLIIDRNLVPGDRINLGGSIGDVEEIGLRSTRLKMGDGNMLIVPNSDLVNNKLLNLSLPGRETTASAQIRVPATVPFQKVRAICLEVAADVSQARREKKAWAHLVSLADGHQLVGVGFWVEDLDLVGPAVSEFNEKVLARLASEGIPLLAPVAARG